MDKIICKRQVVWHGVVEDIVVDHHVFSWSGKIPCTGVRKCLYCGQIEDNEDSTLYTLGKEMT